MDYIVKIVITDQGVGRSVTGGVIDRHFVRDAKSKGEAMRMARKEVHRPYKWYPDAVEVPVGKYEAKKWKGTQFADICVNCEKETGWHRQYAEENLPVEKRMCNECANIKENSRRFRRQTTHAALILAGFVFVFVFLLAFSLT